jgi:hypothetical protein
LGAEIIKNSDRVFMPPFLKNKNRGNMALQDLAEGGYRMLERGGENVNISSDFEIIAAVLAIFKYYRYICSNMTAHASRRTAHPGRSSSIIITP